MRRGKKLKSRAGKRECRDSAERKMAVNEINKWCTWIGYSRFGEDVNILSNSVSSATQIKCQHKAFS